MVSMDATTSPLTADAPAKTDHAIKTIIEIKLEADSDEEEYSRSTHNSSVSSDQEKNKTYFCQRCLNHNLKFQRKGHKPDCKYATCTCTLCLMVEQRRQINYELSIRKTDIEEDETDANGKRIRNPKCARCSAHGKKQALRGHKKVLCPFNQCNCDLCGLVESRRMLMARQIRIRRNQRKQQGKGDEGKDDSCSNLPPLPQLNPALISKPPLAKPTPMHINDAGNLSTVHALSEIDAIQRLGHTEDSAFKQPSTAAINSFASSPINDAPGNVQVLSPVDLLLLRHIQTLMKAQASAASAAYSQLQNLQQMASDNVLLTLPQQFYPLNTNPQVPVSPLQLSTPPGQLPFLVPIYHPQAPNGFYFPFPNSSSSS